MARAGLLALCLALLAAPPRSSAESADVAPSPLDPGVPRDEVPLDREAPGPLAVFARLEEAWAGEDAEALVAMLDPDERVRISMSNGAPRGGYFNRDQAFFLLKDMFEYSGTDRFEFEKFWNLDSSGRSPYAVAVRDVRGQDGVSREDRVYISLRKRGDAWWVGEIRSIDR